MYHQQLTINTGYLKTSYSK